MFAEGIDEVADVCVADHPGDVFHLVAAAFEEVVGHAQAALENVFVDCAAKARFEATAQCCLAEIAGAGDLSGGWRMQIARVDERAGLVEAGVGIASEWRRGECWREHVAKEHDELERLTFEKESAQAAFWWTVCNLV